MKLIPLGRAIRVLLALLLVSASPGAWATLCSEIFFQGADGDGLNAGVPLLPLPSIDAASVPVLTALNPRVVQVSDSYWSGGSSPNSWKLTAPSKGTARVYVKGTLNIANNSEINKLGKPENLIIVVMGDLIIADSSNVILKALIYVTGDVTIGNNPAIAGGISAVGTLKKGNNVAYDNTAIGATDFGTLCDNPAAVRQIDHYRLLHAASGLTCNPLDVTLQACAEADCSRLYEGSVNVTLSSGSWEGGNSPAFNGGQTFLKLHGTTPGYLTLGMSAALPAANNPLQCRTNGSVGDCRVYFADSGFVFDVPNLLAGKPQAGIALQAVRKDDSTQRCVPAFGPATRTLRFWSDHVDPGTGSMAVRVNGGAVATSAASPSSLNLTFDSTATTLLSVHYDDAGLMRLNARYDGVGVESGLLMLGSDQFVSKPYGLHISSPADATCTAANLAGCSVLRMAGDSFPLTIRAVAWQVDGEALTEAALRDNPSTPNFRLNGIALNASLLAPAAADGGQAGTFYRHDASTGSRSVLGSYDHVLGATTSLAVSQSEVGIYRLSAAPATGSYFGQDVGGGVSALIGRFTPAYLGVTSDASLSPACGAFSYQGQTINFAGGQPGIVVTGYSRQGMVTKNYDRDPFWRLAAPQRQAYGFSVASKPNLAARLQSLGEVQSLAVADSGATDGSRAFDWRAEGVRVADALLWRLPSPPTLEDLPVVLSAAGEHVQLKLPASQLTDLDGVCYRGSAGSAATCQDFVHAFGGTELRLGRLRIDAASGPENQTLDLPYWLESWQNSASGPAFGATSGDSCSLAALGKVVLAGFTGDLQASHFPSVPGTLEAASGAPLPTGVIRLPVPNHTGSALASLSGLNGASPALPWLLFDWNGDGTVEAPAAQATFGLYSGPRALIFRQEIYR